MWLRQHLFIGVVCLAVVFTAGTAHCDSPAIETDAIHPVKRLDATPANGGSVAVNPPPLLWPVASGRDVRYRVRLAQDARFSEGATIGADGLRWAIFNPHQELARGTWYWQYGTTRRPAADVEWSDVFRFDVDASARSCVAPSAVEMIRGVPQEHPRILVSPEKLELLRERIPGTKFLRDEVRSAEKLIGQRLRGVEGALPTQKGSSPYETKNFAKWASKGYAARLLGQIKLLTTAYLATGDERFATEAVRRGVLVASFDPDGPTARKVSDFADGSCMEAMALVYDSCHDRLAESEKELLRDAMVARAAPWFARQMNDLESRIFSAHVWQHILQQATEVALALLSDVPEAEEWLSYVYELWLARVPLLGGDDGGWANGVNYFGTNFKTLLEMPTLFERFTGADCFGHPWYRNTVYYQIYAWPPGSASDGFGDGAERQGPPSTSRAMFVAFLGRRFQDPAAVWYARRVAGDRDLDALLSPMLLFDRVVSEQAQEVPEPALPEDFPQARAFRDVGIVAMHTDLATTDDNLMLAFRSSPFGSFNHMHSDQNSFDVLFGGRRLFSGSGYYIAYGDEHFKNWYTHTRAHNSVLIDDRGQVRGADGFGWIPRYLHGRQISYASGDASNAYGDAGLTRFRRHVALLRPDIVVVYDDLEADHPARWSWLLHSPGKMTVDAGGQHLLAAVETARAQVDLFAAGPLEIAVSDQFEPPAVNWRKRTSGGSVIEYPNQWHATAVPKEDLRRTRFLAVFQIHPTGDRQLPSAPVIESSGAFRITDWRITAQLDPAQKASLLVERADGKAVLAVDCPALEVAGTRYDLSGSESLLVEDAGKLAERCADELPEAAR